jgi:hypothetical protein
MATNISDMKLRGLIGRGHARGHLISARLRWIFPFQSTEICVHFRFFAIPSELGHNLLILFFAKPAFGEITENGLLFSQMIPEKRRQAARAEEVVHSSFAKQRVFHLGNECPFVTVFQHQLTKSAWVIRGAQQRGEKDRLFHQVMVLLSKKPKEFEDGRNVGDFDPFRWPAAEFPPDGGSRLCKEQRRLRPSAADPSRKMIDCAERRSGFRIEKVCNSSRVNVPSSGWGRRPISTTTTAAARETCCYE